MPNESFSSPLVGFFSREMRPHFMDATSTPNDPVVRTLPAKPGRSSQSPKFNGVPEIEMPMSQNTLLVLDKLLVPGPVYAHIIDREHVRC